MDFSLRLSGVLVALGVAGGVAGFTSWIRPGSRGLARLADWLGLACVVVGIATWAARWVAAGHLPLFGTYESALSLSVFVLLAALLARARLSDAGRIWPVACALSAALVLHGLRFDPTIYALTISERSWVVDVHAVVAWAAFGALFVNAGLAARLLWLRGDGAPRLEAALASSLSLGFAMHTAMLATGSVYAFLLFGRAWSFDPIETLGFVAWIAYGTLLHMHLFAGWRGPRLARWCTVLFLLLIVSFRAIVYFPPTSTYHIFDVDLRIHVMGTDRKGEQ